ncbi:MAG: F0F1 ATP synthase subunit delta [Oscillospiraceae bacterium]|nr:F0F1 ATP synthase subunit delta [Oscillospiraceae bacterium]
MEELTGKTTTHVVSAAPLGDEQIAALKDVLSRKTGKDIELSPSIDPSLIGGLYISVD